jgi:hypothetical protein
MALLNRKQLAQISPQEKHLLTQDGRHVARAPRLPSGSASVRRALAIFGGLLLSSFLVSVLPASGGRFANAPKTIVRTEKTILRTALPIDMFDLQNGRIAWSTGGICGHVKLRALASGSPQTDLGEVLPAPFDDCESVLDPYLVLAGERAVWAACDPGHSSNGGAVAISAPRSKRRNAEWLDCEENGDAVVGMDRDRTGIVYAVTNIDLLNSATCGPASPCTWAITGGHVARVRPDGKVERLHRLPPLAFLAASAGRMLVVPTDRAKQHFPNQYGIPLPTRARRNETARLVSVSSGRRLAAFAPKGTIIDVALTPRIAAVEVQRPRAVRIVYYTVRTGAMLGNVAAPRGAAEGPFVASGPLIAYTSGRSVRVVDTRRGTSRIVATTRVEPSWLSLDGRRLGWVEDVAGGSRVSSLKLG